MIQYLPSNLDLDIILQSNPPEFRPFKKEVCVRLINLVLYASQFNKDLIFNDYIPISSKAMKKVSGNYRKYLDYLIRVGVLDTDNQYFVDRKKPKGYRLTNKYQSTLSVFGNNNIYTIQKHKRQNRELHSSTRGLGYLNKWFNPSLEIDYSFVHNFIEEEYKLKKSHQELRDFDTQKKRYKVPFNQYKHALISIDKIENGFFQVKRDTKGKRYHSNLTNLRGLTRNALTYNGMHLVSIDIKNCQPYLSVLLLDKEFWTTILQLKNDKIPKYQDGEAKIPIITTLYNKISPTLTKQLTNIMCQEIANTLVNTHVSAYIELVVNGVLYEYLGERFTSSFKTPSYSREFIKDEVFRMLFSDNRFSSNTKRLFATSFPEVNNVFSRVKKSDNSLLPCLLQAIESYLVVDVIAKRISIEFANAPIYTIHDSIVTTKQYASSVERIMHEELERVIGHKPKLYIDSWCKTNMDNHLEQLRRRSKSAA